MSQLPAEPQWITVPLSSLQNKNYKVALNIRELTQLTNDFSKKYVGGCTAQLIKSFPKELSMQYRVKCSKAESDPAGHEVRVKFEIGSITSNTTLNDMQVKISCSCPAFLYWGAQWHLHQNDALEGQARPLLQAPKEQLDKRNNYLVSKHAQVVAKRIVPAVSRVVNNVARRLQEEERLRAEEDAKIQRRKERAKAMRKRKQDNKNKYKLKPIID